MVSPSGTVNFWETAAPLARTCGRTASMSANGVSSSNNTARSTHASAAISSPLRSRDRSIRGGAYTAAAAVRTQELKHKVGGLESQELLVRQGVIAIDETGLIESFNPAAERTFGYAAAETLVQVLKQCGNDLSRENVMKQAAALKDYQGSVLLPGIKISTGPWNFRPIKHLRLLQFDGRTWQPIGEVLETAFSNAQN